MASTSIQTASSSNSSSTRRWRYDVFLSFYGKDTRKSFTDHLHTALKQKGIIVFRDDEKLEQGKKVSEELLKAIQESMYAIVVISANYASSRWCLIELAKIVKCMRDTGLTVLPIFYLVDPSNVRNQTGTFEEALARHEKDPKVDINKMQTWRAALTKVGKISGWHVNNRPESIVVEEISRRIFSGLSCNFLNVSKVLVGIESRVEEVMRLLSIGLDDVRFLGIYGMGGIGKTTLSKVIYERVSHQFEASCFIADIREETRTHGLLYLQKQLIYEILMEKEINIWNKDGAIKVIANRVRNKKVFIVLDDVDGEEQLEALAGSHDWFGQGSRIIITSRDRHLLNGIVNNTYEVKELNDAKALQLFSWKAFKKSHPEKNYVELSNDVVNYAQGLPLALEVFGSFLFGRTMDEWKSARDRLKENPNAEILNKLQISFDGLEDLHKKLFLDIACFFNGAHIDRIIHKLESFGYYPNIDLKVLEDKSLITISQRILWMHDLLRKMGQKIVHFESAEEPGGRSRLWRIEDVLHILKNDTGTDAVKGIFLKLPLQKQERLNVEAFSKMKKLKMLQISNVDIVPSFSKARDNLRTYLKWHGDPSNFMLTNELCVMEWWGYPFESLPTSFQPNNLVELILCYSCIKQPLDGRKSFDKLKRIDLSHSQNLIETPDLSRVPNLEKLKLVGCTSLCKVHPSMGFLRQLKELDLQDCKRLKNLPNEISLESLEDLNLSGCSRLNKFPDIVGHMTSLRFLNLTGTAIKLLPLSFKSLSSLLYLIISGCCSRPEKILSSNVFLKKLRGSVPISFLIPSSFLGLSSLKTLDLSYCNLLDGAISSDLSCLSSLRSLNLSGNKFTRIPDSVAQLSQLWMLDLEDCSWLQVLPKLPLGLEKLRVKNCPSLEIFYNQMDFWTSTNCSFVAAYIDYDGKPCKILHLHPKSALWTQSDVKVSRAVLSKIATEKCPGLASTVVACGPALLGSGIPEWFNEKSPDLFGTIQMHIDLGSDEWKGYALFIVYQVHEPDTYPRKTRKQKVHELENSKTKGPNFPYFVFRFQANEVRLRKPLVLCAPGVPSIGSNGFWVYIPAKWFRRRVKNSSGGWSNLEASITTGSLNVEVKECGARVVRQHDASEFYQVLNSISPHGLDLKSYDNLFFHLDNGRLCLKVDGPIKGNQML